MGQEATNPNNNLDAVFHILHAGNSFGNTPSTAEMDAWINTYQLENAALAAKDGSATESALQFRECTYLVDTSDMKVMWKECSCPNASGCVPSVQTGLQQLEMALQP